MSVFNLGAENIYNYDIVLILFLFKMDTNQTVGVNDADAGQPDDLDDLDEYIDKRVEERQELLQKV